MRKTQTGTSGKLTVLSLAAATYFMVSGGPYGVEELVQDSGYKLALIILFLTPLFWALPTGLMVGELSAAMPEEGGFYVWVRRAMGPFWGFQEAWLSLVASIFDMAIYPSLFVAYLGKLFPAATEGHRGIVIAGCLVLVCLLWNLFGAKAVGNSSVTVGVLLLSPFVVLTLFALVRHVNVVAAPLVKGDFLAGVLVAMWNYMGWDNAATVANEVENPQKTYPRVMLLALAAIFLSYVIPLTAVWRTHIPQDVWNNGSWASIAGMVVGPWLGVVLVATAMLAEFSSFNSLVMSYCHLPVAMAEDGHLPRMFTRKLKSGAPWVSILVLGLAWGLSLGLPFSRLIMLDILLYGASLVLEFAALAVLRVREPALARPFRVPGGLWGAILVGVGPTGLLVIALVKNYNEHLDLGRLGSINTLVVGLALMAAGVVYYFVAGRAKPQARAAGAD
ncbi:MAG TPA: APC family permease [Candidatus Angelobacter sp.]